MYKPGCSAAWDYFCWGIFSNGNQEKSNRVSMWPSVCSPHLSTSPSQLALSSVTATYKSMLYVNHCLQCSLLKHTLFPILLLSMKQDGGMAANLLDQGLCLLQSPTKRLAVTHSHYPLSGTQGRNIPALRKKGNFPVISNVWKEKSFLQHWQ